MGRTKEPRMEIVRMIDRVRDGEDAKDGSVPPPRGGRKKAALMA